ncbi:MAG TPA: DNA repair protein RecO [Oligoflexia bacterium]|nr:DNA repair protein RecO [Oligoflexia bacterium]HMR24749.1 DNA repair protein RecO [Oligoflexia bacterium]
MTEEKTQAIVLSSSVYGENDMIISLLTKDFGKISAFAMSAKKSKKRFSGGIDLFSYLHVQLKPPKSKSSFLWRLEKTQLLNAFYPLRSDLKALASMSYLSECLKKLLADEQKQETIFLWWEQTLNQVANGDCKNNIDYLKMDFELLSMLGYRPHIYNCVHCAKEQQQERFYFSFEKGGTLCKQCFVAGQGMWINPAQAQMMNNDNHVIYSEQDIRLLGQLMHRFMVYTLGHEPKSQSFRWDAMQL